MLPGQVSWAKSFSRQLARLDWRRASNQSDDPLSAPRLSISRPRRAADGREPQTLRRASASAPRAVPTVADRRQSRRADSRTGGRARAMRLARRERGQRGAARSRGAAQHETAHASRERKVFKFARVAHCGEDGASVNKSYTRAYRRGIRQQNLSRASAFERGRRGRSSRRSERVSSLRSRSTCPRTCPASSCCGDRAAPRQGDPRPGLSGGRGRRRMSWACPSPRRPGIVGCARQLRS